MLVVGRESLFREIIVGRSVMRNAVNVFVGCLPVLIANRRCSRLDVADYKNTCFMKGEQNFENFHPSKQKQIFTFCILNLNIE